MSTPTVGRSSAPAQPAAPEPTADNSSGEVELARGEQVEADFDPQAATGQLLEWAAGDTGKLEEVFLYVADPRAEESSPDDGSGGRLSAASSPFPLPTVEDPTASRRADEDGPRDGSTPPVALPIASIPEGAETPVIQPDALTQAQAALEEGSVPGIPDQELEAVAERLADVLEKTGTQQEETTDPAAGTDDGQAAAPVRAAGAGSTPWAARNRSWDGPKAASRLVKWANGDASKLNGLFLYRDPDSQNPASAAAHAFPVADIIDGRPAMVFAALPAAAARLNQAKIPTAAKTKVRSRLNGLYRQARTHFKDESISSPLATSTSSANNGKAVTAAGSAAAAPPAPPRAWFEDPQLDGPTPLTITSDGRVYGHLAAWSDTAGRVVCHTGSPSGQCITVPTSASAYRYFHTGSWLTADGGEVPVGSLVVGSDHAGPLDNYIQASSFYADSSQAVAVARAGEDAHGIWVAGSLLPEATDQQVRTLRRTPLSGDWRPVGGQLELVAALGVNTPGFPVPRESQDVYGQVASLTAAGALAPADPKLEEAELIATMVTDRLEARAVQRQQGEERRARLAALTAAGNRLRAERLAARAVTAATPPKAKAKSSSSADLSGMTLKELKDALPAADWAKVSEVVDQAVKDGTVTAPSPASEDTSTSKKSDSSSPGKADTSAAKKDPASSKKSDTPSSKDAKKTSTAAKKTSTAKPKPPTTAKKTTSSKPDTAAKKTSPPAPKKTPTPPAPEQPATESADLPDPDKVPEMTLTELKDALSDEDWREIGDALDEIFGEGAVTAANWVSKAGGLPSYIKRISKHLRAKGMSQSHAIAVAVNVAKKACANPDGLNFPGVQKVTAKTKAKACAAVTEWEAKKAKSHAS